MLANALLCVLLIALAANAMLSASVISAKIAVRRIAQTYAAKEYATALESAVSSVATSSRAGGLPSPLPEISPVPAHCADPDPPCAFSASASIALLRSDVTSAVPCTASSACAANEQRNSYVSEGRVEVQVSAEISARDGTPLAQRAGDVTLRVLRVPPYAVVTGASDRTVDIAPSAGPHGEDAGMLPASPNPCADGSPGSAADTVVRVAYQNAQTGECRDGSSWRTTGY